MKQASQVKGTFIHLQKHVLCKHKKMSIFSPDKFQLRVSIKIRLEFM